MTDQAAFWSRMAARYAARPIRDEATYAHTLARAAHWLPPGARVLELGCGTGTTALRLAPHAGEYLGTDIAEGMIAIARQRGAGVANLRFDLAPVDQAGRDGAPWDAALAFNLLHLLDNPALGVRTIFDRLRPGGVFASKTICLSEPGYGVKGWAVARLLLPGLQGLGKLPAMHRLTRAGLERLFTDAGFEIVESDRHGTFPHMQFIVARRP